MTASLGEMVDRVRSVVRDTQGRFVSDTDIIGWLNEAQWDLAARLALLDYEVAGTTTDDKIPFPTGTDARMLEAMQLQLNSSGWVEFVDQDLFQSWKDSNNTLSNTLGRVFGSNIELYPTPDVGTDYRLRYKGLPPAMVNGEDTHSLPVQLERKLVLFAEAQAKYKDGEDGEGDRYQIMYEQGLPPVSVGRETAQPGPMTLQPMTTWFDLDAQGWTWTESG